MYFQHLCLKWPGRKTMLKSRQKRKEEKTKIFKRQVRHTQKDSLKEKAKRNLYQIIPAARKKRMHVEKWWSASDISDVYSEVERVEAKLQFPIIIFEIYKEKKVSLFLQNCKIKSKSAIHRFILFQIYVHQIDYLLQTNYMNKKNSKLHKIHISISDKYAHPAAAVFCLVPYVQKERKIFLLFFCLFLLLLLPLSFKKLPLLCKNSFLS